MGVGFLLLFGEIKESSGVIKPASLEEGLPGASTPASEEEEGGPQLIPVSRRGCDRPGLQRDSSAAGATGPLRFEGIRHTQVPLPLPRASLPLVTPVGSLTRSRGQSRKAAHSPAPAAQSRVRRMHLKPRGTT